MRKLIGSLFVVSLFALSSMASGHGGMNGEGMKCGHGKCGQGKCGQGKCGSKGMNKAKGKGNYRAVPAAKAQLVQEGANKNFGPVCGMTLSSFYKTNHAANHNGKEMQYCSIHCLVEDAEVNGKKLTNLRAVDNVTLKLMDSSKLFFVVGSKKPGTMSPVSKYAFSIKSAAKDFAKENGGKIMSFKEVYALTKERLKADIAATKKRQSKAATKGEKIYNKMCKKTDKRFENVADAKSFLKSSGICGNIKGKKHQQVALFLSGRK